MNEASHVLIADDEPSIRFFLRETLEGAGHQVDEAASGGAQFVMTPGGAAWYASNRDLFLVETRNRLDGAAATATD